MPSNASAAVAKLRVTIPSLTIAVPPNVAQSVRSPQDLTDPVDAAVTPMETPSLDVSSSSTPAAALPLSAPAAAENRVLNSPRPTLSKDRATRIRQLEARRITWAPRRKGTLHELAEAAVAL